MAKIRNEIFRIEWSEGCQIQLGSVEAHRQFGQHLTVIFAQQRHGEQLLSDLVTMMITNDQIVIRFVYSRGVIEELETLLIAEAQKVLELVE